MPTSKKKYADCNVVLLSRDPRDTIVTCYFKHTKRSRFFVFGSMKQFTGSLSKYLRDERYGIEGLITWLNIWAGQRNIPHQFILIRYEDMHKDAAGELWRLVGFLGMQPTQAIITAAVEFASFENMQRMETKKLLGAVRIAHLGDPKSRRVRRGKIGGFVDYFTQEDIGFANEAIMKLDPFFGYAVDSAVS